MRSFEVPIIDPDLRHEEAILQSLNALDHLNNIIGNVFDRINNRIKNNEKCIVDINKRINVVNSKIDNLESKKAFTLFSTNKYPEQKEDFNLIFKSDEDTTMKKPQIRKLLESDIKSSPEKISQRKPGEKLQFYHVKGFEKKNEINRTYCTTVPLHLINSVDSLVVFKKDGKFDKSKSSSVSSVPIEGSKKLEAAPTSIGNKNQKRNLENIFYTPSAANNAPQLDLPMDLPDLPGIAGDITFDTDKKIMELPLKMQMDHISTSTEPDGGKESSNSGDITNLQNVKISKIEEKYGDIPKPPIPDVETKTESANLIPPPPPPPSMPVPPKMPTFDNKAVPPASNARLNLLADIRKAGGKAKRSAAASDRQQSNEKKKEKPPPTDDLMSDLRNRLNMRRKGIKGNKEENQPSDMMSKLSTLIPEPVPGEHQSNKNNDSDDDWN